ncbi:molybdenum cofactor guanylyltransferase [Cellulomonas sp. NPDC055163]
MTGSGPERPPSAGGVPGAGARGPLTYDALVLAGGRARRLGGVSKPDVLVAGRRLLAHVLDAAAAGPGGGARRTVVVAPGSVAVPGDVLRTLEDPPDGGPVAGIAAGLAALGRAEGDAGPGGAGPGDAGPGDAGPGGAGPGDAVPGDAVPDDAVPGDAVPDDARPDEGPATWVLVLACDVPRAAGAVPHLVAACSAPGATSGALLVDADGRDQPLVGLYRRADLDRALAVLAAARDGGTVRGASVRALLAPLTLARVPDDASAAADVDTWDDVRAFDGVISLGPDGVAAPGKVVAAPGVDLVARPGTRATAPWCDDGDGPPDPAARPDDRPGGRPPARPAPPATRSTRPPEEP